MFVFNLVLLKLHFSFRDADLMTLEDWIFIIDLKSGKKTKDYTYRIEHNVMYRTLWHGLRRHTAMPRQL